MKTSIFQSIESVLECIKFFIKFHEIPAEVELIDRDRIVITFKREEGA